MPPKDHVANRGGRSPIRASTERGTRETIIPRTAGIDRIKWFIPASLVLHGLFAAPWRQVLAALLAVFSSKQPLPWIEAQGPTVLPIDLADEPVPMLDPPKPTSDNVLSDPGGAGVAIRADTGAEISSAYDGGLDAPETPSDAFTGTASDVLPEAEVGPKPRVRDPSSLAGGLEGIKPKGKEINVAVLIRLDHLRAHPIGKSLGARLMAIPQWRPFFAATGLDPIRDFDAMLADGPRFYESSKVSLVIAHHLSDGEMAIAIRSLAAKTPGSVWFGDADVPAFRGKVDGADKVIVMLPGGLVITTPDAEKQAMEIARKMVEKNRPTSMVIPRGEPDLLVGWFVRKPSAVLAGIPDDLNDSHITIRSLKDGGLRVDMDGKAKDEKTAAEDAVKVKALVESHVPKGIIGMIARRYIDNYTVESEFDIVRGHYEIDGDRLRTAWELLNSP